jgi:hypothetical protein
MKPTDLRNANWREVLTHVTEDMARVHNAWLQHGPGTTREVAELSHIPLLTLRPRTSELYALGLVDMIDSTAENHSTAGVYRHCAHAEAEASRAWVTRADFRRSAAPARSYATVEQALADLTPSEKAALGARLMGEWGHLNKRRNAPGSQQLDLIPA